MEIVPDCQMKNENIEEQIIHAKAEVQVLKDLCQEFKAKCDKAEEKIEDMKDKFEALETDHEQEKN